jgi:hypothetical protein
VGAGATSGAMVGAGITLAGTPAANAMIGAGTAAITTELNYESTNQDKFETDPFITTTAISATVGGVSAVLPPGVGGALAKGGVYIAGAEAQYASQTKSWTPEGALVVCQM